MYRKTNIHLYGIFDSTKPERQSNNLQYQLLATYSINLLMATMISLRSHQCDRMWYKTSRDTTRAWPKNKRRDTINQLCITCTSLPVEGEGKVPILFSAKRFTML